MTQTLRHHTPPTSWSFHAYPNTTRPLTVTLGAGLATALVAIGLMIPGPGAHADMDERDGHASAEAH